MSKESIATEEEQAEAALADLDELMLRDAAREMLDALIAFDAVASDPSRCRYIADAQIGADSGDGYSIAWHGYAIKRRDFLDLITAARAAIRKATGE